MPYLCCLCLFVCSGVQHVMCGVFGLFIFVLCTLCCQCLWVVFVLCLVHTMLPVSGCQLFIAPSSCVHYVASVSGLSILYCPFRILERLFTRLRMITLVRFNVRRIKLATLLSIFIYIYISFNAGQIRYYCKVCKK